MIVRYAKHNIIIHFIFKYCLDTGVANILKCQLIPYLLPTKTIIRSTDHKVTKKNWKPSCGESAAAFITHIAVCTYYTFHKIYKYN